MKVAAITVVAQHPKGLDLHIHNLRWALQGTLYQIYIFTKAGWHFDKALYPDVVFIEVPGEPIEWYNFWHETIPSHIRTRCSEDIYLFTELDMFYHKRLFKHIHHCYVTGDIVISDELYHPSISVLQKVVYPRIWEGGCIIHGKLLLRAITEYGISLHNTFQSDWLLKKIKQKCKDEWLFKFKLADIKKGDIYDTFVELYLFCYIFKIPVVRCPLLIHFPALEAIHRLCPHVYGQPFKKYYLSYVPPNLPKHNAAFMFYLSEAWSYTQELGNYLLSLHPSQFGNLVWLQCTAHEWMSKTQLNRLNFILKFSDPEKRMGLLSLI
jgi:hypothetical protein